MRTLKFAALLAVALFAMNSGMVRADLTPNEIVSYFNSLNAIGGSGMMYSSSPQATGERRFTVAGVFDVSDLATAYRTGTIGTSGGTNSFNSFCIEPNATSVLGSGLARLNYSGNSTSVDSDGKSVSVGTALLYKLYATGEFASNLYDYSNTTQRTQDSAALTQVLRNLMVPGSISQSDWNTNKYLQHLLSINANQSFWTQVYDPGRLYGEIGNYAVFVMNITNTTGTGGFQDFLYIARADYGGSNGVPEPATMLLWTLGSIGTLFGGYYRKRNKIA